MWRVQEYEMEEGENQMAQKHERGEFHAQTGA